MDESRFDTLIRTLGAPGSRRRALGGLLASTLGGLVGATSREDAAARKKRKACPPCKKRKKGKCKAALPDGTACSGGTCRGGSCVATTAAPPPPCANGIQDGAETDIDCGGSCKGCADGRVCLDRDDCASAHCTLTGPNGLKRCQACKSGGTNLCSPDGAGNPCKCDTTVNGQTVCNPAVQEKTVAACGDCPPGTNCVDLFPNDGVFECFRPCAA
jgi:hypothetical protein